MPLGTPVNTAGAEDSPFITPDGTWGEPEEVVSTFAAEPTLTADGRTLYFVHHYFTADLSRMLEADIYVTRRMER